MEKAKSRFTSFDVWAVVSELQATGIIGCHLQNIYDIAGKTFLLKFTKKDTKIPLVLEPGVRFHSTRFDRENPNVLPSSFVAKLRKHLRERRLTKFSQLGFDRIVHFEFGHDSRPEATFHLFLELYSIGNLILTDHNYKVLALTREVKTKNKETGEETKVLGVGMTFDSFKYQSLSSSCSSPEVAAAKMSESKECAKNVLKSCYPLFTPNMMEYCLQAVGLDAKGKLDTSKVPQLVSVAEELIGRITAEGVTACKGVTRTKGTRPFDLYPSLWEPCESPTTAIFPSFNEAADEYFYQLNDAREQEQQQQQEAAVSRKFENIRREQESRIRVLQDSIQIYAEKAQLIEANVGIVEEAILVINTGLRNGLNWDDLASLIATEKARGRPIAHLIEGLRLASGLVDLRLPSESDSARTVVVDVDIRLGGHANANRHYELRKAAMEKLERTNQAFSQAMRSAEAKVRADARKESRRTQQKQQQLIAKRKPFWFEKFNWFISSDNYLVLSGKDAHQNEYLVKRLLKEGDVYVHADLSGASSVIVKNHRRPADESEPSQMANSVPIPHRTLLEAGAFSLCFSKAWEAKIVTSAWWVHASQVSKTAPSGEYLGTGSFMVRGRKNFLPPAPLALSFGFMFVLDEESAAKRRAIRLEKEAQRDLLGEVTADSYKLAESKYANLLETSAKDEIDTNDYSPDNDGRSNEDRVGKATMQLSKINIFPSQEESSKSPTPKKTEAVPPRSSGVPRGKHGKQKKIKEKYKDQDEEEREIRLALLGSRPTSAPKTIKPQPKAEVRKGLGKETKVMPQKAEPLKEHESGILNEVEEEGTDLGELAVIDSLTGSPSSTDIYTGVLAVAAPFMVMQHYKYRVKLLPGNLKRGTAAKTALSLILAESKNSITEVERNLIRSAPDAQLNSTMPAKVRIAGSGVELSKIKKAKKNKK